uniref:Dpy-19 like C-mannosyltransferase 3 n=1 Tax=Loxodonta africana TaxID=9785 RepID=G3TYM9_LOXAF
MMSIRQRKGIKATEIPEGYPAQEENVKLENKLPSGCTDRRLWKILWFAVGGTIALCSGLLTSVYLATLHENDLWFSNIKVWGFCDHRMIYLPLPPGVSHVDE